MGSILQQAKLRQEAGLLFLPLGILPTAALGGYLWRAPCGLRLIRTITRYAVAAADAALMLYAVRNAGVAISSGRALLQSTIDLTTGGADTDIENLAVSGRNARIHKGDWVGGAYPLAGTTTNLAGTSIFLVLAAG